MEDNVLGRKYERKLLEEIYNSKRAEFVAVYGRRRVGKTYLIREYFETRFAFHHTAISPFDLVDEDADLLVRKQLEAFLVSLRKFGDYHTEAPKDWFQAFEWLESLLSKSRRKRLVVFIDELPWLDTPRAGFVSAFEHFWNGWGSGCKKLMLIVCGSAASWINDELLNNTGGLYGRTTREIHLSPFTLSETREYFKSRNIVFDNYDLLQCYMVMGGIPYYLSYIEKGLSLAQNIDNMFFQQGAKLQTEFTRMFKSLFVGSEKYVNIVRLLSTRRMGFTRLEITEKLGLSSGGGLTQILNSLVMSDFVVKYVPYGGSSRDTMYKLVDMFSLFYMYFVEKHPTGNPNFWQENLHSHELDAWRGFSFEEVCYMHQDKIKAALGIAGVHTEISPWRSKLVDDHSQVDMLINRDDRVINVCEMKFSMSEFEIDKAYDLELSNKLQSFVKQTKCRKNPHLTMVTTYGLKQNMYSGHIQKVVTADDLF